MNSDEIETTEPAFKVGAFVRCAYDFYHFFSYWYDEEAGIMPFHGVVVEIMRDEGWFGESVYQVYCLDGQYRFFLEDEMELVYNSLTESP
jgi:hypothetical protein